MMLGTGSYYRAIFDDVTEHPGATAAEIGKRVHNIVAREYLLALVRHGVLYREGRGGNNDPFRYYRVRSDENADE